MTTNSLVPSKDQKEKQILLTEVGNLEKQLWQLIHSKSLLHSDVQDLYHKVRSSYEKIIVNDRELGELQDVEYCLWKLHYKHIDEFRKAIKKASASEESRKLVSKQSASTMQRSDDKHTAGFKSFLSDATEFYQNLIVKIRKCYGLSEDIFLYKKSGTSTSSKTKMPKYQFLCHRFLVCLGDLARYRELYEKPDIQKHNWSVAASHYLEATMIWPDSGNPQNQLAVLATYVGDEFLALYHCVRSLAVKEPFPDALDNLILLFERNRSAHLHSLSSEAYFDFLKPFERSKVPSKLQSSDDFSNCNSVKAEDNCSVETELWSLLIRTMSFFFLKSSLDEFNCAFASAIRELDALMALDDTKLSAALESYQCLVSARTGPFRALQVTSIFIFIIDYLVHGPQGRSKDKNGVEELVWTQFAMTTTFIFMGRLVNRCLNARQLDLCPLLPALLVFVEWLVDMLDEANTSGVDEKGRSAISYFFSDFIDLLNRLNIKKGEGVYPDSTSLWEDYELRGFAPLASAHASLDFSAPSEHIGSYESGNKCRTHRIINAAMKIAKRPNDSMSWIFYDSLGRKFYTGHSNVFPESKKSEKVDSDLKVKEPIQHIHETTEDCEEQILKTPSNASVKVKPVATEEEEVILFKPLIRYNSAPLYASIAMNDQLSPKDSGDEDLPSDECLRRATSLLIAQNQAQRDPLGFHADVTNFRCNKSFRQQESHVRDSAAHPSSEVPISAGPPSLSAWVLNRGSLSNDREKVTANGSKHRLEPIEETVSTSLSGLSISESRDPVISSDHEHATTNYLYPTYSPPMPSAPLLPDDAVWFSGIQSSSSNYTSNFHGASQVQGTSNWSATYVSPEYGHNLQGHTGNHPPPRRMTSSEWLRQYRENHNLGQGNSYVRPSPSYAPENLGNFQTYEPLRFGVLDRWGNPMAHNLGAYMESPQFLPALPLVYGADEHREKLIPGYQRPSPLGCGAVTDLRIEPQPLLQYLKEKEWLLQQDPTLKGPTYMGN